jgi:hypothetical protein
MAWEVYEGGRPDESISENPLAMALLQGQEVMCPDCSRDSAAFMLCSAEAVRVAGQLPDDQVWLAVFNGMQRMLAQRSGCKACPQVRSGSGKPVKAISNTGFISRLTR